MSLVLVLPRARARVRVGAFLESAESVAVPGTEEDHSLRQILVQLYRFFEADNSRGVGRGDQ